jgi:ketosteroid isomerase-like protein
MTNTERFQRWGEAFERRDREAWDAETAPDISMTPVPGWPDPGPFVGRDSAWEFMLGTEDNFDEVIYDGATEVMEKGDVVFVCAKRQMRPAGTADLLEVLLYMIANVGDGGVVQVRSFLDRDQALDVAGIS